jgi:glycosyltransferase involved in cell wall biosynthesis
MNDANPDGKVSVVITCYKYAHFLNSSMESVLGQTYRNIEVLMVNDGSPDNTDEVMKRYIADPRVVSIKQENAGQAIADDSWALDKLEKQMALFAAPQVGVVYCNVRYMDEAGEPLARENKGLHAPRRGRIAEHLFRDNLVPFCAAVVRRECFEKVGVMDTSFRMGIDWDLWLRMSVHYEFDFVAEPLLNYRVGHSGQMSKNYLQREQDTMRIMRKFIADNPELLPPSLVSWAFAYSYCNRGYHYRRFDLRKSLSYYLRAIGARWNHADAYIGIAKWMGSAVLVPFGIRR